MRLKLHNYHRINSTLTLHRSVIVVAVVLIRLPGIRRGCARARSRASPRCDHWRPPRDILQRPDRFRAVDLQRLQPPVLGVLGVLGDPGPAVRVQGLRGLAVCLVKERGSLW